MMKDATGADPARPWRPSGLRFFSGEGMPAPSLEDRSRIAGSEVEGNSRQEPAMLEAASLSKRYEDGVLALDNLDCRIGRGEIYCLLGANGAGKTTTINLFLGFIRPTAGQARINGIDVHKDPLRAKKYVAYVPEQVMLYGHFTGRQNLEYFARLSGQAHLTDEDLDEALAGAGLAPESFGQRVRKYSKGMRQKVAIAIAMIKDAPAILLDEPTAGLDPRAAAELISLLANLKDHSKAILMSTHDVFRAREVASRVGIMKQGRLIFEKSRQELAGEDLQQLYLSCMGTESGGVESERAGGLI